MEEEPHKVGQSVPAEIDYSNPRSYGAGRKAGTPNRTSADARAAISLYVESNMWRLQEWLDMIAHGYEITETDAEGNTVKKRITPNPAKAYELFMSVIEYHVPKLTRSESKVTINNNEDYTLKATTAEDAAREYNELING